MLYVSEWPSYCAVVAHYGSKFFSKQTDAPFLPFDEFLKHWKFLRCQLGLVHLCKGPEIEIDSETARKMLHVATYSLTNFDPKEFLICRPALAKLPTGEELSLQNSEYPAFNAGSLVRYLAAKRLATFLTKCPDIYRTGVTRADSFVTTLQQELGELIEFLDVMVDKLGDCQIQRTYDLILLPVELSTEESFIRAHTAVQYVSLDLPMQLSLQSAATRVLEELTRCDDMPL